MLKEYLEYRCGMYFWLKDLYIVEPTAKVLTSISEVCRDCDIEDYPEHEGNFIDYFKKLELDKVEDLVKEIRVEYARLFLGPKHIVASPYESVYTSCTRSIFGESCIQVRELYKNAGLEIESNSSNIPEDFIGYELEFMYYLSYKALKALEENDLELVDKILKYQHYFFKEHLGKWIEPFTDNVSKNTNMEFFKILAEFTKEFITSDEKLILELVENN